MIETHDVTTAGTTGGHTSVEDCLAEGVALMKEDAGRRIRQSALRKRLNKEPMKRDLVPGGTIGLEMVSASLLAPEKVPEGRDGRAHIIDMSALREGEERVVPHQESALPVLLLGGTVVKGTSQPGGDDPEADTVYAAFALTADMIEGLAGVLMTLGQDLHDMTCPNCTHGAEGGGEDATSHPTGMYL